jgi:uncharacterized protein YlxP (DUF503 family)
MGTIRYPLFAHFLAVTRHLNVIVGTLELSLRLSGCESLKDKRRIIRSLMDRARNDFHVAISEVGDQELWGNACIGVACVSNNAAHADSTLQHVLDMIDNNTLVEVEGVSKELIRS